MNKYIIALHGCVDITTCELELNDKELEFLIKISKEINKKSSYQCQPHIAIYENWTVDEDGYINIYGKSCVDLLEEEK